MKTTVPLLDAPNIRHGFFSRKGGCSSGIYASLNCGPGSDDKAENIAKNRRVVLSALDPKAVQICGLYQIHSNIVHFLDKPWGPDNLPKGDAIVTRQKNIALGILTADCAPVLFSDPENGIIGAAHAGWKGALNGVLENTIQMMCDKGAKRANIRAAIGPAIVQKNYEVGPEFKEAFKEQPSFFRDSHRKDHYLFDLKGFVLNQLEKSGLSRIVALDHDTYDNPNDYFSYRRTTHAGETDYGRQISAIMIL
ncbi:MAG: peptidoglycan editing factor PgeF [Alphaproteobacteria bacterium]|nr:peptidoglycan editing factor PgeF [Alphaproteobacteria bacterium]